MSGTLIVLFPVSLLDTPPPEGLGQTSRSPNLQLTQVMTTPVSAQPGKGGFPKRFWSQSQESVFAPIPCGVPFEPRPGVRCNPGGNRLLAGEQDPRGGGGGLPLAGGGGSDDFEADFVRESLGCCLLAGPPVPQDAPGVREPQPKYPFV